jgi:hypothetical protein
MYRDGGNYKQYNEFVFFNDTEKKLEEIEIIIKKALIDGEWFNAENWNLPDLHFVEYAWDSEIDYPWHEFIAVKDTNELPTSSLLISTFLKNIV